VAGRRDQKEIGRYSLSSQKPQELGKKKRKAVQWRKNSSYGRLGVKGKYSILGRPALPGKKGGLGTKKFNFNKKKNSGRLQTTNKNDSKLALKGGINDRCNGSNTSTAVTWVSDKT